MANYGTQFDKFQFAMKDRYDKVKRVQNLAESDRPLLAMIGKDTDFSGDGTHIPLIYSRPQGIATTLADAQLSRNNLQGSKFILTAGDYSGSVTIADKTIKASRNNQGAFFKARAAETDNLISTIADDLATALYGNGGLSFAQISEINGNVLTLANPGDTFHFEVGTAVEFSTSDGTSAGAVRAESQIVFVESVQRADGTITLEDASYVTGLAVDDYIFRRGTFPNGELDTLMVGLEGYLWANNAPPVLYGMDRTKDPIRQAGARLNSNDIRGKSAEQRLRLLGTQMTGKYRGKGATHGFVNPEDWDQIVTSLSTQGIRSFKDDSTKFGFESIHFTAGGKRIKLYADPFCPKGEAFLLRLENWKLHSMGQLIHPIDEDGQIILRGATANTYEFRAQSYPVVSCNAPGWSGRVSLT
jgi:hypothetical protein